MGALFSIWAHSTIKILSSGEDTGHIVLQNTFETWAYSTIKNLSSGEDIGREEVKLKFSKGGGTSPLGVCP